MSRDMVEAYVERLLEEINEIETLKKDEQGGYAFRHGTSAYAVRVVGQDEAPAVRIWSVAVMDLDASQALLEEVNRINQRLVHARCFWAERAVVFEDALAGLSLNKGTLQASLAEVAQASAFFGPQLKETHGGSLAFAEQAPAADAKDPSAEPAADGGIYL